MTDLALPQTAEIASLMAAANDYGNAAQATNTIRAYRADWAHFTAWCASQGLEALPAHPVTVALYLVAHVPPTLSTATLSRRLTTIKRSHAEAGRPSPTSELVVQQVWKGIRRVHGIAKRGKAAARRDDVRVMIETRDLDHLIGVRDRALLSMGFAGAFRRSEITDRDIDDITEEPAGLRVWLDRSKTDQEAKGASVGLSVASDPLICPVRSYRAWIAASGITEGPVFRAVSRHGRLSSTRLTDQTVARVVKRAAKAAGLSPVSFAGHSLRRGLITSAAEEGVSERRIMDHSRHRNLATVRAYIEEGTIWDDNASAAVLL